LTGDAASTVTAPAAPVARTGRRSLLRWVLLVAILAIPLATATIVLAQHRWYAAVQDFAWTEFRVRDVGGARTPLVGLPGRIGTLNEQGSHPGPLSFYALAPFYRAYGASAWALRAAAATLNVLAVGVILWIAGRRGGIRLSLAFAAALAVLLNFLGPSVLTMPWNPYMPVLWWLVFLVAVWSVLCDDMPMLPVAVFAGAFCLHTHISYTATISVLGTTLVAFVTWSMLRRRAALGPRPWLWILSSVGILVITSIPILIQEFGAGTGNLTVIWRYFTSPPEDPIGIGRALEVLLVHFDPTRLVTGRGGTSGSPVPGLVLIGAWLVSVAIAVRLRHRRIVTLDAVIGLALVVGLISVSRIFGFVWDYLVLSLWATATLMAVATGWTVVAALERSPRLSTTAVHRALLVAPAVVIAVMVGSFTVHALDFEEDARRQSDTLGVLADGTVRAIRSGDNIGDGPRGEYLVIDDNSADYGERAKGLVAELERAGIRAGLSPSFEVKMTPWRTVDRGLASAQVRIAVGPDIERWRKMPGAVEVAYADERSPAQRAESLRLERALTARLDALGRLDLLTSPAESGEPLPASLRARLKRFVALGSPTAVFLAPPDTDRSGSSAYLEAFPLTQDRYRRIADRAPRRVRKVLAVGDWTAFSLGYVSVTPNRIRDAWGMTAAIPYCQIVDGQVVVDDYVLPPPTPDPNDPTETSECPPWPEVASDAVAGFEPHDVVLLPTGYETWDHEIDGEILRVGTPAYAEYIERRIEAVRRVARAGGARLSVTTVPCSAAPTSGDSRLEELRADPARVQWVNAVLREYVASRRDVRLIDVGPLLCPNGNPRGSASAIEYRPDGANLSPAGVDALWKLISRRTSAAATEAPR